MTIKNCLKPLPQGGICGKPMGQCIHSFTPTAFGKQIQTSQASA